MNGAWLPVCPLGGTADDLPTFGMHTRKAPSISWLNYKMFAQTINVPTNLSAVGTPMGGGGAHVPAYSYMHFHVLLLPRMP